MKIINTKKEELLQEQKDICIYNKQLGNINEKIIDKNNTKWMISVFLSAATIYILLLVFSMNISGVFIEPIKYIVITMLSVSIGIIIGSRIIIPFYKPLLRVKKETKAMHIALLLNKYNPIAIARKGEKYLLLLENKDTKVVMKEIITFKYIEKTNISEIVLDVDNERLYIPYFH